MNDEPQIIGDQDAPITQDFVSAVAGMGMEKTVTVYNPLPLDFRVKYTRSVATNAPVSPELQYTKDKTGLDLSRRGQISGHVAHTIILKAGSLTNLPGDIAQIAVQKLITVIIQTRNDDGSYNFEGHGGNKGMVPDPYLRREVEQEVIKQIKDTMSIMNRETPEQFTERQIEELNAPEVEDETPAPGTGGNYTPKEPVSSGAGQPDSEKSGPDSRPESSAKPKRGRPKKAVA